MRDGAWMEGVIALRGAQRRSASAKECQESTERAGRSATADALGQRPCLIERRKAHKGNFAGR